MFIILTAYLETRRRRTPAERRSLALVRRSLFLTRRGGLTGSVNAVYGHMIDGSRVPRDFPSTIGGYAVFQRSPPRRSCRSIEFVLIITYPSGCGRLRAKERNVKRSFCAGRYNEDECRFFEYVRFRDGSGSAIRLCYKRVILTKTDNSRRNATTQMSL